MVTDCAHDGFCKSWPALLQKQLDAAYGSGVYEVLNLGSNEIGDPCCRCCRCCCAGAAGPTVASSAALLARCPATNASGAPAPAPASTAVRRPEGTSED